MEDAYEQHKQIRKLIGNISSQRDGNPGIVNPGIEKAPNLHKNCIAVFFKIFFSKLLEGSLAAMTAANTNINIV